MAKYDIFVECIESETGAIRFMKFREYGKYAVTGAGKMVMRYLKALLTIQGTDPHDLEYGTQLMALSGGTVGGALAGEGGANVLARDEAGSFLTTQNSLAVDKLREYDSASSALEDAERIQSAEIVNLEVGEDYYNVYIYLKTMAGEPISILVSLPA